MWACRERVSKFHKGSFLRLLEHMRMGAQRSRLLLTSSVADFEYPAPLQPTSDIDSRAVDAVGRRPSGTRAPIWSEMVMAVAPTDTFSERGKSMGEEPRPRRARPDQLEEINQEPPLAEKALPFLGTFLASAIAQAVGGLLLAGNDLAVLICVLSGAAVVILSYFLPNGPLRKASKYRWTMVVAVLAALVVPASVVLLRNEQGMGYTLTIAAATSISCAVLLVAAFELSVDAAIASCAFLLAGDAGVLMGVEFLIEAQVLGGVARLLMGFAVLLWGIGFLIAQRALGTAAVPLGGAGVLLLGFASLLDGSPPLEGAATLLLGFAVLLAGVTFLIDGSPLIGVAVLLAGFAFLLWGVSFLIGGSPVAGVGMLLVGSGLLLVGAGFWMDGSPVGWVAIPLAGVGMLLVGSGLLVWGVSFLIDGSSLLGGAVLLMGVAILFALSKAVGADHKRSWISYWFGAKD